MILKNINIQGIIRIYNSVNQYLKKTFAFNITTQQKKESNFGEEV